MSTDMRARYMNQRVMTATPAQRVVMLYDRLSLDLTRAAEATKTAEATKASPGDAQAGGEHIDHAMQIVAELTGSLKTTGAPANSPVENLGSLYGYLLSELSAIRCGATVKLPGVHRIVDSLRDAWTKAATSHASSTAATAGAWVG